MRAPGQQVESQGSRYGVCGLSLATGNATTIPPTVQHNLTCLATGFSVVNCDCWSLTLGWVGLEG